MICFVSNIIPSSKNGVTDQFLKVFSKQHHVLEVHKFKKFRDLCSGYKKRFLGRSL